MPKTIREVFESGGVFLFDELYDYPVLVHIPKKVVRMKTFADLEFGPHLMAGANGKQARMMFPNGYGVSVVRWKMPLLPGLEDAYNHRNGYGSYTMNETQWELAVLHGDQEELCYATNVTDDVLGFLSAEDVTVAMARLQAFPRNEMCVHHTPDAD